MPWYFSWRTELCTAQRCLLDLPATHGKYEHYIQMEFSLICFAFIFAFAAKIPERIFILRVILLQAGTTEHGLCILNCPVITRC